MNKRSVAISDPADAPVRREPARVPARGQGATERPSAGPASSAAPCSPQRRWSGDFCRCGASPIIVVKRDKKEPQPPRRGVSLLRPRAASHHASKRYSCPPVGVFGSPSSSNTSSCASPPPVQTSVITGSDPLGWKLRPKSGCAPLRARTNRLSLQIPLPVAVPAVSSGPGDAACPDPCGENKPPLRPKPLRRRHSDSSAFLRSLPVVTLEELRDVRLRQLALQDEPDDVFGTGAKEGAAPTARARSIPPPVPEKTSMARQIAQLMSCSHRRRGPLLAKEEVIYSSVVKPKVPGSHRAEDHSGLSARITGLRVDAIGDRERSTPRFPG
ncbi:uncharacterized protein LOC119212536 [Pungitius pungitius]|uniref:uncharacterized protein LOC119212536 n=1 Tax=Pungitius pungitius TaxID=134920 RepID=UPI002E100A84